MPVAATKRAVADSSPLSREEIGRRYDASGYDLATHPAHLIRRAHQRATLCFQELLGEKNLTPTQLAALATITKHGELSQNQLGRLTAMDPSTISIVVKKLLAHGLVQRSPSASDQRLSLIRPTDEGVRYTLPLLAQSVEVGAKLLAPLTTDEQKTFMALLHRVAGTDTA